MKKEVAEMTEAVYTHTSKLKGESAITLVALIITIIVLIILAFVTIKVILDHKLISTTTKSIGKYDMYQKEETKMLNDINDILDNTIKGLETEGDNSDDNDDKIKPVITKVTSIGTSETTADLTVEVADDSSEIVAYKFYIGDILNANHKRRKHYNCANNWTNDWRYKCL